MIKTEQIKQLREKTKASVMECKKALEQARGDMEKAEALLKDWGKNVAAKKKERTAGEGLIEAYIHSNGKIGVLIELRCETDFVARNEEFKDLAHNLAMQIAATSPADEKDLLSQPFIKNPNQTIKDLIEEKIGKLGENIKVGEFIRYEIG